MARRIGFFRQIPLYIIAIAFGAVMLYPFLLMTATSFKTEAATWSQPSSVIPSEVSLAGYEEIMHQIPFLRIYGNSFFVAISVMVLSFVVDSMAAYAIIRARVPGYQVLLFLFVGTMMIPFQVRMIPVFNVLRTIGWLNSYRGLILPRAAGAFGIFLFVQFFRALPMEMEDAAAIDGCSTFRIYWNIILPLSTAAIATYGVSSFTGNWNDLMYPLIIVTKREMMTLPVALALFRGSYVSSAPTVMAGATLAMAPVVVLFIMAQRYFVESLALTGLKG
jgi:multiple sugar transport system permease protein